MEPYFDLGSHTWPISTSSDEAQVWFDRGLMWCYGFNHEEAVACFEKATTLDPDCAMAYWGIAYAAGPNYNLTWEDFGWEQAQGVLSTCYAAVRQALALLEGATALEAALIRALAARYPAARASTEEDFARWNDDYATAMRAVHAQFPAARDVCALCAEALITRTPWALWDLSTGTPATGALTVEAMTLLETAIQADESAGRPPHPGLLHIYIHTMEMSPYPERTLRAADTLRDLVPDAGHLLHMPSHIDILCGHYHAAVVANSRAIGADEKYLAYAGAANVYTMYRCHNFHFQIYAAMFLGQFKTALQTAEALASSISEEVLRIEVPPMADQLESLVGMRLHVLIRFGQWQTLIDEPLPADPELYSFTTALVHYARGVAHAASGNVTAAASEEADFAKARARVPESRKHFNNSCHDLLAVAAAMLAGELAYRRGLYEEAYAHLRTAVTLDDNLLYAEPWGWMQPTRHALGALLLEQGHEAEALAVYQADLGLDQSLIRPSQHPDNVWSLHGYVECLRRLGRHLEADAAQRRLDVAQARADVPIHSSCFCRGQEDDCCQ